MSLGKDISLAGRDFAVYIYKNLTNQMLCYKVQMTLKCRKAIINGYYNITLRLKLRVLFFFFENIVN